MAKDMTVGTEDSATTGALEMKIDKAFRPTPEKTRASVDVYGRWESRK